VIVDPFEELGALHESSASASPELALADNGWDGALNERIGRTLNPKDLLQLSFPLSANDQFRA
jgi:hypothetical protein